MRLSIFVGILFTCVVTTQSSSDVNVFRETPKSIVPGQPYTIEWDNFNTTLLQKLSLIPDSDIESQPSNLNENLLLGSTETECALAQLDIGRCPAWSNLGHFTLNPSVLAGLDLHEGQRYRFSLQWVYLNLDLGETSVSQVIFLENGGPNSSPTQQTLLSLSSTSSSVLRPPSTSTSDPGSSSRPTSPRPTSTPIGPTIANDTDQSATASSSLPTKKNIALSAGAIAGIVIGVLAVLLAILLALFLIRRRSVRKKAAGKGEFDGNGKQYDPLMMCHNGSNGRVYHTQETSRGGDWSAEIPKNLQSHETELHPYSPQTTENVPNFTPSPMSPGAASEHYSAVGDRDSTLQPPAQDTSLALQPGELRSSASDATIGAAVTQEEEEVLDPRHMSPEQLRQLEEEEERINAAIRESESRAEGRIPGQ